MAGTTYRIAVDGNSGSTGTFDLEWRRITAPARPTVTDSTPGPGSATVDFVPGDDGGSPITSYVAQCVSTNGGVTERQRQGVPARSQVNGLTGGKNYRCRVRATNAIGTGSLQRLRRHVLVPPTAPAAPTVTSTTPRRARSRWGSPPTCDGGSPITSYAAQCVSTDGGVSGSAYRGG